MANDAELERKVAAALRRAGYSNTDVTLAVGVSGGPDSCALLYSLDRLKDAHGLSLHVAHLNHNFRVKKPRTTPCSWPRLPRNWAYR